jgi:hypothetical protein
VKPPLRDPCRSTGRRDRLALAQQYLNLPQFRDNLLSCECPLGHFPGSFLSPVSLVDWYRKRRADQISAMPKLAAERPGGY